MVALWSRMLRGWVHSGFQVHPNRRIAAHECQDIERLAQYIVRNLFCVANLIQSGISDVNPRTAEKRLWLDLKMYRI